MTDGKTWPALIGQKATESFKHVWVNNAGLDGHSTFGHTVLMKDFIIHIKPKVVLFLVGINDLWAKTSNAYDSNLKNDLTLNYHSIKGFLRTAGNYSEVVALAYNLYRYSKKIPFPYTDTQEIDLEKMKRAEIPRDNELEIIREKHHEFKEKYEKAYRSRLKQLIKTSRENNIQPILLTQPALYGDVVDDVTKINLGSTEIENGENGNIAWKSLEHYNDVTRAIGLEQNVLVIDLASEMPKSTKYFYDFIHFNNDGSEKVAEIVYNRLLPYLKNNFSDYSKNIN
jgi:lysophospholipase L1-like esterase